MRARNRMLALVAVGVAALPWLALGQSGDDEVESEQRESLLKQYSFSEVGAEVVKELAADLKTIGIDVKVAVDRESNSLFVYGPAEIHVRLRNLIQGIGVAERRTVEEIKKMGGPELREYVFQLSSRVDQLERRVRELEDKTRPGVKRMSEFRAIRPARISEPVNTRPDLYSSEVESAMLSDPVVLPILQQQRLSRDPFQQPLTPRWGFGEPSRRVPSAP